MPFVHAQSSANLDRVKAISCKLPCLARIEAGICMNSRGVSRVNGPSLVGSLTLHSAYRSRRRSRSRSRSRSRRLFQEGENFPQLSQELSSAGSSPGDESLNSISSQVGASNGKCQSKTKAELRLTLRRVGRLANW